ncbi:Dip2/Utp12 family-domain-containing protein [Coniella lustricola]|uniref:Dip2/Utp12 family-domain-containing protein n=1 Tax=Coniella lustricola TaxID=2025994 RepID=A0A2T2ZUE4_9PEZI|nr:Dip2/Utp12 family-domain-containing protein [Coniella lustricola]
MATKRKLAAVAKPMQQSAKQHNASRLDESKASVSVPGQSQRSTEQAEPIEISSDSESNYDDISDLDDDDEKAAVPTTTGAKGSIQSNGAEVDAEMKDQGDDNEGEDDEDAEPTFGDLIRNHETVDVAAALQGTNPQTNSGLATLPPRQITAPSATSLGTVLAQALRTDDADLLESCLQISDTTVIRNTIQRLDSSLASALLTQLASRLHRRPGRAHNLMSFVQWTLIAHGGALATQPEIQRRLAELNRVLEERSRGLNSLLALKGKLDMLEAQMTLRRGNKTRGAAAADSSDEEDDGEEGVIYVEGQEDEALSNGAVRRRDDDDDDLPIPNGTASDSEDDSEDEDQDEIDVDEFAEESLDEDDVDHDDIEEDSAEEEDESEPETAPPAKVQKKTRSSFSKR